MSPTYSTGKRGFYSTCPWWLLPAFEAARGGGGAWQQPDGTNSLFGVSVTPKVRRFQFDIIFGCEPDLFRMRCAGAREKKRENFSCFLRCLLQILVLIGSEIKEAIFFAFFLVFKIYICLIAKWVASSYYMYSWKDAFQFICFPLRGPENSFLSYATIYFKPW